MDKIKERLKIGSPLFVAPYKESKVWGINGVGEYWYGAEKGNKSSVVKIDDKDYSLNEVIDMFAEELLGSDVVSKFGNFLPLVKILTPKGRLSMQFHDAKNELWVVTGIDKRYAGDRAELVIGFSDEVIDQYGEDVREEYKKALEKYGSDLNHLIKFMESNGYRQLLDEHLDVVAAAEQVEDNAQLAVLLSGLCSSGEVLGKFYNKVSVGIGDVIPVPQGTLHALGPGIIVVEPQIPGPTQSMEDGSTYPVRYNFPEFPAKTAKKGLDLDRIGEIDPQKWSKGKIEVIKDDGAVKVENLPGGFGEKGMGVLRINMKADSAIIYDNIRSYHVLVAIGGEAFAVTESGEFQIPQAGPDADMLLIPCSAGYFKVRSNSDVQIIDTYTPV